MQPPPTIINLPPKINPNFEEYEIRQFYTLTEFYGNSHIIPHDYVFVLITYSGSNTEKSHSWKNSYNHKEYKMNPLGFKETTSSFFEDFYELTKVQDPTFGEGESWCTETNKRVWVEKTDPNSVWNPLERRYDKRCDYNTWDCDSSTRVSYGPSISEKLFCGHSLHELFKDHMSEFLKVYCKCCICKSCSNFHEGTCAEMFGL
jgi:hypothetical protein